MKFNWGTGILIAIIFFCSVMIATGIFMFNQKVDLVTDDYYEKTLVYQDQIDLEEKTKSSKKEISFSVNNNSINISLPEEVITSNLKGEVYFYRPSDKNLDFKIPLLTDNSGTMSLQKDKLKPGMWKVRVYWSANDEEFYSEKSLYIE